MEIVERYFPDLTSTQKKQFEKLPEIYSYWNSKINVISRKDFENLNIHHILHSLAIAKYISLKPETKILDVGTGGGFPGIPLAILFPAVNFHLIDSIGKKIKVVNEVATELKLHNVFGEQIRAEDVNSSYDFIVSRAVTQLPKFLLWIEHKILKRQKNDLPNGVLYLKGLDIDEELKQLKNPYTVIPLQKYFSEPFFETKALIHIKFNKKD